MLKPSTTEMDSKLDAAAQTARTDPKKGIAQVVALLNAALNDNIGTQSIMDGASARGFICEYWPTGSQVGIRVSWWAPKKG